MSRTLWVGCRGGDVAAVQDALNQVGANAAIPEQQTSIPLLVPDGVFGNKTLIRVKDFQHTNGLAADGIVGPVTLGRLQELLPAVQAGMSTSRPAGGVPIHDPDPLGMGKSTPPHPAIHDPDPLHLGGSKTSGSGSKTSNTGGKTSNPGAKTY